MSSQFRFHREKTAEIAASPQALFAFLDDHRRLGGHMERPSLMMAGAAMTIETDSQRGQALGSLIRMKGRVLGIALFVEETIVHYQPPERKSWRTLGEPRLLVIGGYQMGFELFALPRGTRLRVWIDYNLPAGLLTNWLGRMLGRTYADWCIGQMVRDASAAFHHATV
jgi:hypothetical protein